MEEGLDLSAYYRYIPDFITEEEEAYLIRKIAETPQPKWKNVIKRRLQIWGGELGANNTLLAQPLPSFLSSYPNIIARLSSTGAFANSPHKEPNHVIINEYKPGEGIMPHEDGPCYHPTVATISLGSHTVFHYHRYKPSEPPSSPPPSSLGDLSDRPATNESSRTGSSDAMGSKEGRVIDPAPVLSLLLERRSVIITSGRLYKEFLHAIEGVEEDHILGVEERPKGVDGPPDEEGERGERRHKMANWELVRGPKEAKAVREGGTLPRETRVSLTCRDVERVRRLGLGRLNR